jgi:hypothetical protein
VLLLGAYFDVVSGSFLDTTMNGDDSSVDRLGAVHAENALQTMKDVPYAKWRSYDAEDTIRFYALRLNEIGMIKSTPQKIIAQGTDLRSFKELRKELKG